VLVLSVFVVFNQLAIGVIMWSLSLCLFWKIIGWLVGWYVCKDSAAPAHARTRAHRHRPAVGWSLRFVLCFCLFVCVIESSSGERAIAMVRGCGLA